MRQLITITIMTILITSSMFAQGFGRAAGNSGWWMEELNLTAEQQKTVTTMRTQFQKDQIKTRSKMETVQVDLRALMTDPAKNAELIKAKQAEINLIRTELQNAGVDHRNAIRKLLTPEQQVIFDQHGARGRGENRGMRDGSRSGMGRRGGAAGSGGAHTPGTGGGPR